jgi:Protein of unknown function (DUF4199)
MMKQLARLRAMRFGGIAALLYVTGLWILYKSGPTGLGNTSYRILLFGIIVFVGIIAGISRRKELGGYASLRELFQSVFLSFLIAEIAYAIFMFLLFNNIDPTLSGRMIDYFKEFTRDNMLKANQTAADIAQAMKDIESSRGVKMSVGSAFKQTLLFLSLWGTISILIAAILRKRKPATNQSPLTQ